MIGPADVVIVIAIAVILGSLAVWVVNLGTE